MTDIEQIKQEVSDITHEFDRKVAMQVIDYLHSCKYLGGVSEHVEELLKQARDVLNSANNTYLGNEYIYTLKPDDVENTITAIDKFLGEK